MKHFLETIEENSNLYPNRTAILEDDTGITYGEFWLRSSRVYVSLHRRQIGPGDVVMIHLSSTIDTIISCIGIMRAGAAFLIAGSEHDGDAIRYMYEDGGCRYLIDESAFSICSQKRESMAWRMSVSTHQHTSSTLPERPESQRA